MECEIFRRLLNQCVFNLHDCTFKANPWLQGLWYKLICFSKYQSRVVKVSARSRDFSRNFNKLKELFMWYCPIKFEIGLKSILGFKSYDTYWMYFWRISNWSGCKYFQMCQVSSIKIFLLWLIFCFSSSKLILKLGYSQS